VARRVPTSATARASTAHNRPRTNNTVDRRAHLDHPIVLVEQRECPNTKLTSRAWAAAEVSLAQPAQRLGGPPFRPAAISRWRRATRAVHLLGSKRWKRTGPMPAAMLGATQYSGRFDDRRHSPQLQNSAGLVAIYAEDVLSTLTPPRRMLMDGDRSAPASTSEEDTTVEQRITDN
jgi:hypothetical protein